jgi:tetratricopeptide (TPR) repeat protein
LLAAPQAYKPAGPEALSRANAGLDKEARAVLDWAGKYVESSTSGDPLGTPVFTHFWPIPKDDGAELTKYAAAALGSSLGDPAAVSVLVRGRAANESNARSLDFESALGAAYFAQHDWKNLAPVAERLASAYPDSPTAFRYKTSAYRGLQDWKKAEVTATEWLTQHKNDPDGILARAVNAAHQGNFHDGRVILAPLVATGAAPTAVLNEFAWLSVAADEVDASAVKAAHDVSTLACVYALRDRPKEALDVLIHGTDGAPNSSTWFAQGLIAEAYGDAKSAQLDYSRVQPDPLRDEDPASPFNLAKRRLKRLSQ